MDSQYTRLFTTPSGRLKIKGVKIVWFGVFERGPKLKTTLYGDLIVNGCQRDISVTLPIKNRLCFSVL